MQRYCIQRPRHLLSGMRWCVAMCADCSRMSPSPRPSTAYRGRVRVTVSVSREKFDAAMATVRHRLDSLHADGGPARFSVAAIRRKTHGQITPLAGTAADIEPAPTPEPEPTGPVAGYADLYERHAQQLPPETSIGDGDFDRIGRIELSILIDAGLAPSSYLLDFGCGTGRLAIHAVPYLATGDYLGTDISPTMLRHADVFLRRNLPGEIPNNFRFLVQYNEAFPTVTPPDVICAFSVFTHMEHEDFYRYLAAARRVSGPDTVFVASCLPMEIGSAHDIFLASAAQTLEQRWSGVRNVVTSMTLFSAVAELAGWDTVTWLAGDQPATTLPDGTKAALGQSVVILRPHKAVT